MRHELEALHPVTTWILDRKNNKKKKKKARKLTP
jgi:hypothetical protein